MYLRPSWRSEERRVGKECRSLCDWSSDVCSSDLIRGDLAQLPISRGTVTHLAASGVIFSRPFQQVSLGPFQQGPITSGGHDEFHQEPRPIRGLAVCTYVHRGDRKSVV